MQNLRNGTFMPFVYPGSKEYAVKKILEMVPDHKSYAEPFCGSAAVFFAKSKTKTSWLNDINAELINTYKVIRDHPSEFAEAIRDLKVSKAIYNRFVNSKPKSDFERAVKWIYLALNSSTDINLKSRFLRFDYVSRANMREAARSIFNVSRKLQGVKLTSAMFAEVIKAVPNGTFLFIDPPYSLGNSKSKANTYLDRFSRQDHIKLASALKRRSADIKFMLFYKVNPEAEKIFSSIPNINKKIIKSRVKYRVVENGLVIPKQKDYEEMVFTNYKV